QVHLSLTPYVADAAAVQSASYRFQLLDDLHGADFRGAGDRAAGKGARQQTQGILPGRQLAGDAADQVMHVRVAFNAEQLGNLAAAEAAGTPEIVAQQVDDHQV